MPIFFDWHFLFLALIAVEISRFIKIACKANFYESGIATESRK